LQHCPTIRRRRVGMGGSAAFAVDQFMLDAV
jgi:hypothetical protein